MFATPAYASTGAASAGGYPAMVMQFLPFVLIIAIFYFLMIRPQQLRMKQHRAMIDAVKKNDDAVTAGGVIGKVTKVDEAELELEIAQGVRIRVVRSTITEVRPHNVKPAND